MGMSTSPRKLVRPGFVDWFAGTTPPDGWLACNGGTVSRTLYAALFAAIGVTYGAGDGATTFTLPDLRDDFIRGASGSRAVGSRASDTTRSHTHGYDDAYLSGAINNGLSIVLDANYQYATRSVQTAATGGAETAPRHVVMLPCIKW